MIAILGAMQVEIDEILKHVEVTKEIPNNGLTIYEGIIKNTDVVVVLSGVGGNKASMSITQILERYPVTSVINIGTAGGLKNYEEVLDVVISERVLKHDFDTAGVYNIPLGFHDENKLVFNSDVGLQILAKELLESYTESKVYVGDIVSGDKFIYKEEDVNYIAGNFDSALCADMESSSIAEVCNFYNVPFIIIRSLSDIAVKEGNELDFDKYVQKASSRSAHFVKEFVSKIKTSN